MPWRIDKVLEGQDEDMGTDISLEAGDVRVDIEYIGEGWSGDYDSSQPDDQKLLRFTVYQKHPKTGEFEQVDDASYCTRLPVSISMEDQMRAAQYIMDFVKDPLEGGSSIKKLCESLSWIDIDTLEGD